MTEPLGGAPAPSFLDSLGPRTSRRAEPRASIAIAGAGCALAVIGVLIVAGDTGVSDGDLNRMPGLVLSAIVVAAGLVTLRATSQGAVATAGAVAAALGVPPLMFFLTWDRSGFPPYSTEGILIVSTLAWLGFYAVGPGRGRPFFLGAGLIGLWLTILQLSEQVFDAPFGFMTMMGGSATARLDGGGGYYEGDLGGSGFGGSGFEGSPFGGSPFDRGSFQAPDITTLGLLSLGLGLVYLVACRGLDARGRHGIATPFAVATLPTLFAGTVFLADDLEQAGTGLLTLVIGAGLALHGAGGRRRATAWIGGALTALGLATFLADMTDDATIGGMLFMAGGIALVGAGHMIAMAFNEHDEMDDPSPAVPLPAAAVSAVSAVSGGSPGSAGEVATDDVLADQQPASEPPEAAPPT